MKKALALLIGMLALLSGVFLAFHYPLGPIVPLSIFVACAALAFFWASLATSITIALLPVIGFAPWTGWITFEEFDLLVLAIVSGSYFRVFLEKSDATPRASRRIGPPGYAMLLIVLFGLSLTVSLFRGFTDAGGFVWGWYQGYYEPMNSLRLAKSFCLAIMLLPLWLVTDRKDSEKATRLLGVSLAVGLGLASLAAIWERFAFPGLLNFSADYRTTALFWEMHVGGAAFDGFLALTVPFAVWLLMSSRTKLSTFLFGGILALAGYACLTTFSRGVYLGIPAGLVIMALLFLRQNQSRQTVSFQKPSLVTAAAIIVFFGLAAWWIFPTSGYRGMLALVISLSLLLPVAEALGRASRQTAWFILVFSIVIAAVISLASTFFSKGAYGAFFLGMAWTVAGLYWGKNSLTDNKLLVLSSGFFVTVAGCLLIARHWGGDPGAERMSWVISIVVLAVLVGRTKQLPNVTMRWHVNLMGAMMVIGLAIATFGGGAYMEKRFSTSSNDFDTRIRHWNAGMAQLNGPDWWFGKGLGRYPATHFFSAPPSDHPGGYRLETSEGENYLLLSGGKHKNGWSEIFRVTQRVTPGLPPYKVSFDAMVDKPIQLHIEVVEKHLLYNGAGAFTKIPVNGVPGKWQKITADLKGAAPSRSAWYAPRIIAFSVAVETRGGSVQLDKLKLYDGMNSDLLSNGDFSEGLAHWFSSSDKHHMPWHMKSLFFHTLFDQGLIGMVILLIMVFSVLFRLSVGNANNHLLAPVIVGSIAGFLVVGLFDSLIDVPRLATIFYFLLFLGLVIRIPSKNKPFHQQRLSDISKNGA